MPRASDRLLQYGRRMSNAMLPTKGTVLDPIQESPPVVKQEFCDTTSYPGGGGYICNDCPLVKYIKRGDNQMEPAFGIKLDEGISAIYILESDLYAIMMFLKDHDPKGRKELTENFISSAVNLLRDQKPDSLTLWQFTQGTSMDQVSMGMGMDAPFMRAHRHVGKEILAMLNEANLCANEIKLKKLRVHRGNEPGFYIGLWGNGALTYLDRLTDKCDDSADAESRFVILEDGGSMRETPAVRRTPKMSG